MTRKGVHSAYLIPVEHYRMLALAALFEENFSIDWIVDLLGEKASKVLSVLEEGTRRGYLTKKGIGIYSFADLKERRRWQDHLTPEEREEQHKRIADLLIRELPYDDNKAQRVAYHLLYVSNDLEKFRWLVMAADNYLKFSRTDNALQYYTKVLDDLSSLHGEEADSLFAEVAIKYSKISTARYDTKKVLSILNEAMLRAKRWNSKPLEALLEMHLAKNEWLCSQYRKALRHFEHGWSIAKEMNDDKLLRQATTFSTFFLYWQGRFREAIHSYEKTVSDVEKFPPGKFPLLATVTVGICYAHIGQITQGLGMLDTIRANSQEKEDHYFAAFATSAIGTIMLDIRRIKDAIQYLEFSVEEAIRGHNDWVRIMGKLMLAFAYFLNGENKRCIDYLLEFLKYSTEVHMTVQAFPYLMDLCWAMEQGKLPHASGFSLAHEVRRMITSDNIFVKGVAYRYQALIWRQKNLPHESIIQSLKLSLRWLEESGSQVEQARSQLEMAHEYLAHGNEEKAKETIRTALKILSLLGDLGEGLIPDDLRYLVNEPPHGESLLKEILKLGQEVVTIRENKELVQHIISTVNRITGAERGAIFLLDGETTSTHLMLRASKNLTPEQIAYPSFISSMDMIMEVAITGKGLIRGMSSAKELAFHSGEIIRSRICVPMLLRDKVVGVLYHDNRLLSSAFRESDLELLSYFAALAAFALDNTRAYEEIQRLNQKLGEEKQYYEEQHLQNLHFEDIIGESTAIKRVLAQVGQVAATDTNVLILGETGVGKELVARAIHRRSARLNKPFIQVSCNVLPESLIQSELFGHEKGAFTNAIQRRIGRFELADGGTLFLDEIGDLPPEVQVRLLHVLQSKEFERVGGSETIYSDFRLVAATNRDIEQQVNENRFRQDLYYRLNVFPIYVPPLRERKEDIPLLAHHFLKIYSTKMGKTFHRIPDSELEKLIQYDWPGNVRELENIIERGTILSPGPHFRVPEFVGISWPDSVQPKAGGTLKENERCHILWALQKTGWKVRGPGGAAELLDIHPSTLASRMKKLYITHPKKISKMRSTLTPVPIGVW